MAKIKNFDESLEITKVPPEDEKIIIQTYTALNFNQFQQKNFKNFYDSP